MKSRYPSRMYISSRRRYWRRLYFAAAAVVIVLISIATLYNLSEKRKKEKPEIADVPKVPEVPRESPRFSEPRQIPEKPAQAEPQKTEEHLMAKPEPGIAEPEPMPLPVEQTPPVTKETADSTKATAIIAQAKELAASQPVQIIKARDMLNEVLGMQIRPEQRKSIKQMLSELADKWLFSKDVYPSDQLCGYYKVQSGDLLSTIGEKHNIPWEIIRQINDIDRPKALQAEKSIKIINGPFHARVYRSSFTMDLYLQDTFVRSFPVGLGSPEHETPTGLWQVRPGGKLVKPAWTHPDTSRTYEADDHDYPLGSRWIGLEGLTGAAKGRTGFAIHGTKDPDEIGVAKSRGCIRLHNGNAILVYNLLTPVDSKIEVVE